MSIKINSSIISYVMAAVIKSKLVPGELFVKTVSPDDVECIIKSFVEWANNEGFVSPDGKIDLTRINR